MHGVVLQTQWGPLVALYLFLGGLGAGTLCVSAVIDLKTKDRFKNTIRFGAWSGVIMLIVGVLFLVAETLMPLRALLLWKSFVNPGSWMTIGAWLLVVAIAVSGVYALSRTEWITAKLPFLKKWQRGLAIAVVPVSLSVAIYTGVLLGVLVSHPLWHTWLLPLLFTVSALDTGVAFVAGYATLRELKAEATSKLKAVLEKSTVILVVLEAIVLTLLFVTVSLSGAVGQASVGLLTTGVLSAYFWILVVACGLVVPLVISALLSMKKGLKTKSVVVPMVGIVLCLVGGCALRFLILLAGLPVHV